MIPWWVVLSLLAKDAMLLVLGVWLVKLHFRVKRLEDKP